MTNVANSLVGTFTLFPEYVTFTPRYGQLVVGNILTWLVSTEYFTELYGNSDGYVFCA